MKHSWAAAPAVGIAALTLAYAAKVTTDYDKSADFTKYHTYSIVKIQASNDIWQDRIRRDVESSLMNKGLTYAPSGGDLSVAAIGAVHNQKTLQTFYDTFGGGWGWRGFGGNGMATTTVENDPVGSLVVDMFDTQTKRLVWRGIAEGGLSDNPEKNEKKLKDAVSDLFKHFPPKPRG